MVTELPNKRKSQIFTDYKNRIRHKHSEQIFMPCAINHHGDYVYTMSSQIFSIVAIPDKIVLTSWSTGQWSLVKTTIVPFSETISLPRFGGDENLKLFENKHPNEMIRLNCNLHGPEPSTCQQDGSKPENSYIRMTGRKQNSSW